jgi:hypothetical protein
VAHATVATSRMPAKVSEAPRRVMAPSLSPAGQVPVLRV